MTLHCVKGLEFENVYISGIEEGILPHTFCLDKESEIEEERRLLYVGITRAKNELQLHYAHVRRVAGVPKYQVPSRFLKDLGESVVIGVKNQWSGVSLGNRELGTGNSSQIPSLTNHRSPLKNNLKLKPSNVVLESEKFFKIGQIVEHSDFGLGKVLSVDGADKNALLTISFNSGKLKKVRGEWVALVGSE